jgi:uncharacterized protein (TIGR02001 family)
MKRLLVVTAALVAISLSGLARAEEPQSPHTLSGNITLASDFRSRGLDLSNGKPAIQGGLDYAHTSGFYAGTWASSNSILSDLGVSNSLEWDLYAGFKKTLGDFTLDLGATYFYYPGSYPADWVSSNTAELNVAGAWKVLSLTYSYSLTNQFGFQTPAGGDTKGSSYVDLAATIPAGAGFTIAAHLGHQRINGFADASYTDWSAGVSKDLAGLSLGLTYVGTNAKGDRGEPYCNPYGRDLGASRLLATITKLL